MIDPLLWLRANRHSTAAATGQSRCAVCRATCNLESERAYVARIATGARMTGSSLADETRRLALCVQHEIALCEAIIFGPPPPPTEPVLPDEPEPPSTKPALPEDLTEAG